MDIANLPTHIIRVSKDIYYIKNTSGGDLEYSLYKKAQVDTLLYTKTLLDEQEEVIVFSGDSTYKLYVGENYTELRYYLVLQENIINNIEDFLCNCATFGTTTYDSSCATKEDIKAVSYSSIFMMLLSYHHLVDSCLNSSCIIKYLFNAVNEYDYLIINTYSKHIQEESIKGKSLYATINLKYIVSIYYAMFLALELENRDTEDADYVNTKFHSTTILKCIESIGISHTNLLNIMALCSADTGSADPGDWDAATIEEVKELLGIYPPIVVTATQGQQVFSGFSRVVSSDKSKVFYGGTLLDVGVTFPTSYSVDIGFPANAGDVITIIG